VQLLGNRSQGPEAALGAGQQHRTFDRRGQRELRLVDIKIKSLI
jgi:hypothetical protein